MNDLVINPLGPKRTVNNKMFWGVVLALENISTHGYTEARWNISVSCLLVHPSFEQDFVS
jgi:hypothetical protein